MILNNRREEAQNTQKFLLRFLRFLRPLFVVTHYASELGRGLMFVGMTGPNLGDGPVEEIGGPEGSCTLNPPADNGALC